MIKDSHWNSTSVPKRKEKHYSLSGESSPQVTLRGIQLIAAISIEAAHHIDKMAKGFMIMAILGKPVP